MKEVESESEIERKRERERESGGEIASHLEQVSALIVYVVALFEAGDSAKRCAYNSCQDVVVEPPPEPTPFQGHSRVCSSPLTVREVYERKDGWKR